MKKHRRVSTANKSGHAAMNAEAIGRSLHKVVMATLSTFYIDLVKLIGKENALIDANLAVLYHWVASWRISDMLAPDLSKSVLDQMHEGLFSILDEAGVVDSEAFIHEQYAEYYDALKTQKCDWALPHIAACFLGFCNPTANGQVFYSMNFTKCVSISTMIAGFASAIPKALENLIREYSK
ncbi:MAG: hypothetical protein AABZ47_14180 [Planctomycetota bacterium]